MKMQGRALILVLWILISLSSALAEHYVVELGSKSNPNAHLFAYDEKFRESTRLENYMLNLSASKVFTDTTHLSSNMYLTATKDRTEMVINTDFIGIGMIGYVVKDSEIEDARKEMSKISHMFIGNFSIDEYIKVVRDRTFDLGFLGPV